MLTLVSLALCLLPAPYSPPTPLFISDTLRPGHRTLASFKLRPLVDTVDVSVGSGTDRQRIVQTTTTVSETMIGSRATLLVTFENTSRRGPAWDSVWVDRRTFEPLRHDASGNGSELHVRLENGRYLGTRVDSGQATPLNITFPQPLLDYSLVSLMAGQLPLAEGYQNWLAAWDFARQKEIITNIRVLDRETLPNGKATWKVDMDFGTHVVTSWYDVGSRLVVRGIIEMGSRGQMHMDARH